MTTIKSGVEPDVSDLVDGLTVEADDVLASITAIQTYLRSGGLIGVTDDDGYIGTLNEKLTVSGSGLAKSEQNDGADETLQLALSTALEALNALLPSSGKIRVSAMDSESAATDSVLVANGSGGATWINSNSLEPIDVTGEAGEKLSERDFVYLDESSGTWFKIDTDATSSVLVGSVRGCVNESGGITSASTGSIRLHGEVTGFTGLTSDTRLYASTTAGGYTQTKPAVTEGGAQTAIIDMGLATGTTTAHIAPKPVIYAKRETLADNATLTIEHHSDAQTRVRSCRAYVGASYDEQALIGRWSGGTRDIAVRFDDGSGSNPNTNTTFKNIIGSSADITCEVEVE